MKPKNLLTMKRAYGVLQSQSLRSSMPVMCRMSSVWTKDNTVVSPYNDIKVPNMTLNDYVWQNLDKWPERTVAVCAETGRGYTYEQAFKLSNTFAANLRKKLGIRDGDIVAVILPNMPDYPIVVLGILEAGGTVTTVNPVYTAHEIKRQLLLAQPKAIVTLPKNADTVKQAVQMAQMNIPIITVKSNGDPMPDGMILFNELAEDTHIDTSILKEVRRGPKDICFLPYSSGTTGLPKGVELIHSNLIANCEQISEPNVRSHNETTATHQDSVMTILPLFHIYAISVIMFHKMAQGIKLVTLPKFQPESFLQALEKQRTNVLFAAPPLIIMMASHKNSNPKTFAHLDLIINGAAPLAPSDAERLFEKAQRSFDFRQGYGLTETSPVVTMSPIGSADYGSVGHPLPNTHLRIVDGNLNNLGPNETGELLVRGPQVMRGYKDNAKANAEAFTEDGWFRTGDLATIDDNGTTTISDRLKELIKVKGFQVPPAELEGVLREHPGVSDAAVIGAPHPIHGETPKAFVVFKEGHKTDTEELKNFVKERVAPFKRIEYFVVLDSIPKSLSGKILRRELKDKYCK